MDMFGSWKKLQTLEYTQNSNSIILRPNQSTTYSATRTYQLPPGDTAHIIVSETATQTLSNKTISGSANTITNVSLTTGVTGILPTANGGTGQNSTATFPTSGVVVTEAAVANLTNKTLDNTNTVTLKDTLFTIQDDGDTTKQVKFQASGITTATTRTLTIPDANTTIVGTDASQVLTNKDIDTGTASNSKRITVGKDTTTNLNALTRKQATIVYDTTTNQFKGDDGSTLTPFASSSTASPTVAGIVTSYFPTIQSAVSTVTNADATCTTTDGFEIFLFSTGSNNRTLNLPAASSNTGRVIQVKKTDSGTGFVIIDGNASETIDGATTFNLNFQYSSATIVCNGSNWFITAFSFPNEVIQSKNTLLTIGTGAANLFSVTIPPGKWAMTGDLTFNNANTTNVIASISTANSTQATDDGSNKFNTTGSANGIVALHVGTFITTISSSTTHYFVAQSSVAQNNVVSANFTAMRVG